MRVPIMDAMTALPFESSITDAGRFDGSEDIRPCVGPVAKRNESDGQDYGRTISYSGSRLNNYPAIANAGPLNRGDLSLHARNSFQGWPFSEKGGATHPDMLDIFAASITR